MSKLTHHFANIVRSETHDADGRLTVDHAGSAARLHPQSWYCWREVITELQAEYHIVAPDLRGLGDVFGFHRAVSGLADLRRQRNLRTSSLRVLT